MTLQKKNCVNSYHNSIINVKFSQNFGGSGSGVTGTYRDE